MTLLAGLVLPPQDSVNRFRISVANGVISGTEEYRLEHTPHHLFSHVDGPSTGTEYGREGHVDPRATDAIAAWIGRQHP